MNLWENVKVGIESIRSNTLRTVLTALIIALGITALVGILTAIDGMKASIADSFSKLGANSFVITQKTSDSRSNRGKQEKFYPEIEFDEAVDFKNRFQYADATSISAILTWTAEVKRLSKKTSPNTRVYGGDEYHLGIEGYDLDKGRNFSNIEIEYGSNVVIIGSEIFNSLFEESEDPINDYISVFGNKYKIVGLLAEQGGLGGNKGADRSLIIPIENANRVATGDNLDYTISVAVNNPEDMEYAMGEATGLMRVVRKDAIGKDNSFDIDRNQTVEEELENIASYMRWGGGAIGFITLLGASIALMNIMMVSVTERTREIGVRKALGATPSRIREQFLIEAIVICLLGGIFGIILGLTIGNIISSFIGAGSFVAPWRWIFMGFVVCILVGIISGFIPARKASRLDPIESLRYE